MTKINTGGPAYPQDIVDGYTLDSMGMTKREAAAMAAMQGILAGYWSNNEMSELTNNDLTREAVVYADALIAALGESQ